MKRDRVLAILNAHKAELQELGVKSLEIFGSVARDEARPDNDVYFLVEFATTQCLAFSEIAVSLFRYYKSIFAIAYRLVSFNLLEYKLYEDF